MAISLVTKQEETKMEELRNKAKETLQNGKWLESVTYDNRTVTIVSNGYECSSFDRFDAEFTTQNIDDAIDYLYPN